MGNRLNILIVDDEQETRNNLNHVLELEGYDVNTANDDNSALTLLEECKPYLVIVEISGRKIDGLKILSFIRQRWDIPVIMLTVHYEPISLVKSLYMGADDYVRKHCSTLELLARIRAKLRRAYPLYLGQSIANKAN